MIHVTLGELEDDYDLGTDELFDRVLADLGHGDGDEDLGALVVLHGRPTRRVLDRSLTLCDSEDPHERIVGLRILRELGHRGVDRVRLWSAVEPAVVRLAVGDPDPSVVRWAISCFAYQPGGPAALRATLERANDSDPGIRLAAAEALPNLVAADPTGGAAVEALVVLTRDSDADVRAYALMGLVHDLGLAVARRDVVTARLDDDDPQIRRFARDAL